MASQLKAIGERFKAYLDHKKIGINQAGRDMGTSGAQVSKIVNGEKFGTDKLLTIFNAYPDLSQEWLLQGVGEMLKNVHPKGTGDVHLNPQTPPKSYIKKVDIEPTIVNDPGVPYQKLKDYISGAIVRPIVLTMDSQGHENIVFVNTKAYAGYLRGFSEPEFINTLPAYRLPGLESSTFRAFQVDGDSMYQAQTRTGLYPGDWVIARYVENWSTEIKDSRVYVIVSVDDGVIVKRVFNRLNDPISPVLIASSDNKGGEYPNIILHPEQILEVWEFKRSINSQLPPPSDIYNAVINLQGDMILMQEKIRNMESKLLPPDQGQY